MPPDVGLSVASVEPGEAVLERPTDQQRDFMGRTIRLHPLVLCVTVLFAPLELPHSNRRGADGLRYPRMTDVERKRSSTHALSRAVPSMAGFQLGSVY
jgi:hypothetical protein